MSVFSRLRQLTKWHCPRLIAVCTPHTRGATAADRRPCSNLSISPARRAHSSKPTATGSWNRSLTTSITTTYDDYSSVAARKQLQMQLAWSSL